MTSVRRHYGVMKQHRGRQWVRDTIRRSCFVTTMNLPHARCRFMQQFLWRSVCGCTFQGNAATNYRCTCNGKLNYVFVSRSFLSATVCLKELLESDSICEIYAQMKKGRFLTHSVYFITRELTKTTPLSGEFLPLGGTCRSRFTYQIYRVQLHSFQNYCRGF